MRIRWAIVCPLILAVFACVVIWASARQLLPARPPPEPRLDDWVDVWEAYDLSEIIIAPGFYTVQEDEQLFHVAMKHKLPGPVQLTIDVLKEINNLWDSPILKPGQRLRVPETDLEQWPIWAQKRWAKDAP
ncbi:MAG: LysM peptidoglycan-binding domain-containing protein [Betaproteobacteria bacterium]